MARPRQLEAFYNQRAVLSTVDAVLVVVVNVGSQQPALTVLELQLEDGTYVPIFQADGSSPPPSCLAHNVYAVPAALHTGPAAGMRVVGVRLKPSQARVARKQDLLQVGHHMVLAWCFGYPERHGIDQRHTANQACVLGSVLF
jgi:hypothetical protein